MNTVKCFLPCRKGSERIPKKNIKQFSSYSNGLIEIKLKQLCEAQYIEEIVLSTNDEDILNYALSLNSTKIRLHHRNESLSSSLTSTDSLVAHAVDLIPEAHILWTHVTSPFVTAAHYDQMINTYFEKLEYGYDSLMSTTKIHSFLWNEQQPINYNRNLERWPRTQTLTPLYEINSAAFIASSSTYKNKHDRIGDLPYLYTLDKLVSHDIDWSEDFILAECLFDKGIVKI